jgi:hypothetical protein
MARQLGAVRLQGKLANVVGYKNPASSKANNNFYRERVYTVSNPKTQAQAVQRAKVRPAQIFYNGFERVLNHAFLPSLRASRNRNRFMSLAMKLDEIPDVMKGEAFLPFCQYQISAGALGLDALAAATSIKKAPAGASFDWSGSILFPNLRIDDSIEMEASDTIGAVSSLLIENNTGLVEGMELTFLAVVASSADPFQRVAQIVSFVLDKGNSVTTLGDIMGDFLAWKKGTGYTLILTTETDDYEVLSAGLIISARAGNTYVYTNSRMCKSWRAEEAYSEGEDDVIASYMGGGSSRGSELILQQASNKAPGNRIVPSSVSQIAIELAEGVTGTLSSQNAGLVTMTNGDKRILIANALGQICDYANGVATPVTIAPAGGSARPLTMADTTFSGNGTITIADVQQAGFEISLVNSSIAIITRVLDNDVEVGEAEVRNATAGDPLVIEGSNLSADAVKLYNATEESYISPQSTTTSEMQFNLNVDPYDLLYLYVNGNVWCTIVVES